jgi:GT2 family glycosyltransferase
MTSQRVAVVICTYSERRWRDLRSALSSVMSQTRPADEVVVVVDHNPDLLTRVRGSASDVRVVENRGRSGLAGARNSGVTATSSDVVVFLDDDAVAEHDWLAHLMRPYGDASVLGVGGAIRPLWAGARPRWFPAEFDWVIGCTYVGLPVTAGPVRNLIGANMSFRRTVFERAGGFAEGIGRVGTRPMGCEETELCLRASAAMDGTFAYEPAAVVHHRVPPERSRVSYFRARCFAEGLSKAAVTATAGTSAGLASERAYARRTIPAGFCRSVADTALGRDSWGIVRGLAMVAGLSCTAAGYVVGRAGPVTAKRRTRAGTRQDATHRSIEERDVDAA